MESPSPLPTTPIRQFLLSDLVEQRLLTEIVSGRYTPGERLKLDAMASEYGVSRMPIREALQALATLGFVEISRQARTSIANWSANDMAERSQVIGQLAGYAASTGIPRQAMPASGTTQSPTTGFLDLAAHALSISLPHLTQQMQRAYITPLRLFLTPETTRKHHVDLETLHTTLHPHVKDLRDALTTGNHTAAHDAFTTCGTHLTQALTLPGTHHAYTPRATPASPPAKHLRATA